MPAGQRAVLDYVCARRRRRARAPGNEETLTAADIFLPLWVLFCLKVHALLRQYCVEVAAASYLLVLPSKPYNLSAILLLHPSQTDPTHTVFTGQDVSKHPIHLSYLSNFPFHIHAAIISKACQPMMEACIPKFSFRSTSISWIMSVFTVRLLALHPCKSRHLMLLLRARHRESMTKCVGSPVSTKFRPLNFTREVKPRRQGKPGSRHH